MTREELKAHILNTYDIDSDSPWVRDPESEVFRHPENRKWFVLLTNAPVSALAPTATNYRKTQPKCNQTITAINVKVDPVLSGSLRSEPGIYPAYHMNKDTWITVDISVVPDDTIKWLVDMSFSATAPKAKKVPKEKKPKKVRNKYPEVFFEDLFCTTVSDAEYADFLIDLLRTFALDHTDDETRIRLQDMRDIIIEYYKHGKTLKGIGEKRGISGHTVSDKRWKGLRLIWRQVRLQTNCSAYEDDETTNYPPLALSEYYKLAEKKKILAVQHEKELEKEQYEYEHGPLSLTDEIQRLMSFDDGIHDLHSFFYRPLRSHGIITIGELLELTGNEKFPGFGKKRWEMVRKAQVEARKRLVDEKDTE